jgi:hypothetical protein
MNTDIYPLFLKTNGDTINTLADIIYLNPKYSYALGLFGIQGKVIPFNKDENLYLCCDIIGQAHVGNIKLPCLDIIKSQERGGNIIMLPSKVMWVGIVRHKISSIRLYITNEKGHIASLKNCQLNCKLLIIHS